MKILQIHNKYLEKGGEDTVVQNERQLLEQNGHEVLLCEFDNKDLEGLSKVGLFFRTVFNRQSYKKVINCLETFKPDVVHLHNVYYEASPAVFFAIKKKKIPAVMTIHNYRFGCIQSLLFRDSSVCQLCLDKKNTFYGIKYRCFQGSFLKSFQLAIVNNINKLVLKYSNPVKKFLFLSEFTKEILSPILSLNDTEGVIKPNYVMDYGYTSEEDREDFYLFVGRLNEQKGIKILINIFIKNKKNLQIIGTGPLEDFVKETAQHYPNIQYLGYANNTFIIDKLKKSKALLVPSITYEGQPMTILEAFSTGTPVFVSNIKNLDRIVANGKNGFLFGIPYIDYIFKVFENFNQSEKKDMYANARKEYVDKYSPQSNYRQLMGIYESVIFGNQKTTLYCEKKPLFHVTYSITDYQQATDIIIENAKNRNSYGVSALAVHGLMECYKDKTLRTQVNKLDMVVPDGQPVRWALNAIHKTHLKDRVCGPVLTQWVLEESHKHALKIYLYGSTEATLTKFQTYIRHTFPRITICGVHTDRFREATPEEDVLDIEKINRSGAHIVLVGRGCPRQERWVSEHLGKVNGVMMAVGAAFDFHSGSVKRAPNWMQDNGLEWLFRLIQEPQRLWKRYLFTNSHFIYLFFKQLLLKKN